MSDANPNDVESAAKSSDAELEVATPPAPTTSSWATAGVLALVVLLVILSLMMNGYLWYMLQKVQTTQHAPTQPDPELWTLKTQVQGLSNDLAELRKAIEVQENEQQALRSEWEKAQKEQASAQQQWQAQIEQQYKQLQQRQRQAQPQPQQQPQQQRPSNPVTW